MPVRGKSFSPKHSYWLLALDLFSLLLNGYQDSFSRGKRCQNMKLTTQLPHFQSHLHPPEQNYTTTHVMPSWHVNTASLHIDIILLFQNLSLEIGLKPTHKFLQNATNTLHIPLFCAPD
jgi:hypothetical protein